MVPEKPSADAPKMPKSHNLFFMERIKTRPVHAGEMSLHRALLNSAPGAMAAIPTHGVMALKRYGRTFEGQPKQEMPAPKFTAMFSLFRQRGPKGFYMGTRYYDPVKEEREERLQRLRAEIDPDRRHSIDREILAQRMRHSWRRQSTDRSHLVRLVIVMGLVMTILYYLIMSFGLLEHWNG